MKGIKIEIKKTLIDSQYPMYREARRDALTAILREGNVPTSSQLTVQETVYEARQVYNPETREKIVYFVKTDDNKIFQDLIEVSNGFVADKIASAIRNREERFISYDIPEIERETKRHIKNLKWWQRLFNRF